MNWIMTFLARNWQRLSLEQYGDPSDLYYVMATPRFRSSSHLIFFVLIDGLVDPILIVKVPRIPDDNSRLNREVSNLKLVQATRAGGFETIPRVIAYEEYSNSRLLIETALAGHKMSSKMKRRPPKASIELVFPWLVELHMTTSNRSDRVSGWFEHLIEKPLDRIIDAIPLSTGEGHLLEQTRFLGERLREREVPLVFEHGDLAPPNILLSDEGGLGVVDWELAEPEGLPAVDLFFFLTVIGFSWRGARSQNEYVAAFSEAFFGPSAWARPYINRYAERLQLSREVLTVLFVLCWSRYVAGLVQRLHDFDVTGRSFEDETVGWLRSNRYYTLWRYALEHIDELNLIG